MKRQGTALAIALAREGITKEVMCQRAKIPRRTFFRQQREGVYTQEVYRSIAQTLHMTDEELGRFVRGK